MTSPTNPTAPPAPLPAPLGTYLEELRTARGISKAEWARRARVSRPTIFSALAGGAISAKTLGRLLHGLSAGPEERVAALEAAADWQESDREE